MMGSALAQRVIAPVCPHCTRPVFLTVGRAVGCSPDGTLVFNGTIARAGIVLHLRRCQEANQ